MLSPCDDLGRAQVLRQLVGGARVARPPDDQLEARDDVARRSASSALLLHCSIAHCIAELMMSA